MRRVLPAVLLAIVAFPAADARAADTTFEVRDEPEGAHARRRRTPRGQDLARDPPLPDRRRAVRRLEPEADDARRRREVRCETLLSDRDDDLACPRPAAG